MIFFLAGEINVTKVLEQSRQFVFSMGCFEQVSILFLAEASDCYMLVVMQHLSESEFEKYK